MGAGSMGTGMMGNPTANMGTSAMPGAASGMMGLQQGAAQGMLVEGLKNPAGAKGMINLLQGMPQMQAGNQQMMGISIYSISIVS